MTQDEIEYRIKTEYQKHHAAGLDWAKIAASKIHAVLELEAKPPVDRFGEKIEAGDQIDVQQAGVHEVWAEAGALWFKPYGKPEKVKSYFSNDLIKIKR